MKQGNKKREELQEKYTKLFKDLGVSYFMFKFNIQVYVILYMAVCGMSLTLRYGIEVTLALIFLNVNIVSAIES